MAPLSPPPAVSVIVPHLNQPAFLERCLASLLAQEPLAEAGVPGFEIIVCDNGSKTLPEAQCAVDPRIRLVREPEPGPGPARNRGVAEAQGALLAFIDADCTAAPHWLARIAGHFATSPDQIIGGDVYIAREDASGRATLLEAFESVYSYRMKEFIDKQGFTGTGNLAMRAEVMQQVGPFAGIGVAEDRDWGQRALAQGRETIYVPDMIVYHPARKSFAELREKWARHMAHDCVEMRRKSFWRLRWGLRAAAMAASPAAEIPYILRSKLVSGPREKALAFVGLTRIRLYRARVMAEMLVRDPETISGAWNRG